MQNNDSEKLIEIEWAQLTDETAVIASSERAWLLRIDAFDSGDAFAQPMRSAGSLATTRNLLDGAIGAAQKMVLPEGSRPELTEARWVWRLAGYYHTTYATPRLMAEAAARFAAAGRHALARYALEKVRDEGGHDELALADLRALGYFAEAVVAELVPTTAEALVDYFGRCVRAANPVGCVGYAYALERLAVTNGRDYIRQVEAALPSGVRATRCLRVHSAASADAKHVEDALEVTAALPAEDRRLVARACYETALIACAPPPGGHIAESVLRRRVAALKPQSSNQTS
ncbi:MAG TPA: iron-containing redox enzyme family protein [Blastocatellia bacterium]|nr:iron-containing redox enzyme family protein [Blastocatellia bacterium]